MLSREAAGSVLVHKLPLASASEVDDCLRHVAGNAQARITSRHEAFEHQFAHLANERLGVVEAEPKIISCLQR